MSTLNQLHSSYHAHIHGVTKQSNGTRFYVKACRGVRGRAGKVYGKLVSLELKAAQDRANLVYGAAFAVRLPGSIKSVQIEGTLKL